MFRSLLLTSTFTHRCRLTAVPVTSSIIGMQQRIDATIPLVRTLATTSDTATAAATSSTSSPSRVLVLGTGWGGFNLVRFTFRIIIVIPARVYDVVGGITITN